MKTFLQTLTVIGLTMGQANAQIIDDSVEIGAGYANQAYYSLNTGELNQIAKSSWDLAFDASGFGAGIRVNDANGIKLWRYPNAANNDFGMALDTNGLHTWPELVNSDTSWTRGAFNQMNNPSNSLDLGWGLYNTVTHAVNGDSLFIIELPGEEFRQIDIRELMSGEFRFRYADLDGQNSIEDTVRKSDYPNKNFGYYSLINQEALDLEPSNSSDWDLLFTQYVTLLGPNMPYGVSGVLMNNGVEVAKVEELEDAENYIDWNNHTFNNHINTIGYDWKSLNYQTFQFEIQDSLVYFIKSNQDEVWKLIFTGFGGSANGKYIFSKERLSTASLNNLSSSKPASLSVYPNPSNGQHINILYDLPKEFNDFNITIIDLTGKTVYQERKINNGSFSKVTLNNKQLNKGSYIVNLQFGKQLLRQKLIVQ